MKTLKILGILTLMMSFTQCKSTKFDNNPPFKVEAASFNNWVGGQPGVKGMKVIIRYSASAKVYFGSLYFAGRETKVETHTKDGKTYLIAHYNTSTRDDDMILNKETTKEINNTVPDTSKFPFELKDNEAVLSFKEKAKTKYVKIENIKQSKTDFYP